MSCYDILAQRLQDPTAQDIQSETESSLPISVIDCLLELYPSKDFVDMYEVVKNDIVNTDDWKIRLSTTLLELFPQLNNYTYDELSKLAITLVYQLTELDVDEPDFSYFTILTKVDSNLGTDSLKDFIELYNRKKNVNSSTYIK